jgi:hypothetical protein
MRNTTTMEFAPGGRFVNYQDRRRLTQYYVYRNNVLIIGFHNPRTGAREEMERGTVEWIDDDSFIYTIVSNADSIRRIGWIYELRRL